MIDLDNMVDKINPEPRFVLDARGKRITIGCHVWREFQEKVVAEIDVDRIVKGSWGIDPGAFRSADSKAWCRADNWVVVPE